MENQRELNSKHSSGTFHNSSSAERSNFWDKTDGTTTESQKEKALSTLEEFMKNSSGDKVVNKAVAENASVLRDEANKALGRNKTSCL